MIKSELAQKLIEARESRYVSLQDASKVLSIRVQVLQDLEAGQYERLGSILYIRNYVKKYADYLKIDRTEIDALLGQLEDPFKEEKGESLIRAQLNEDKRMVHRSFFRWYAVILVALLGVGIAVYFIYGEKVTDIFNIRPTPEKIINDRVNIVSDEAEIASENIDADDVVVSPSQMMPHSSTLNVDNSVAKSMVEDIIPSVDEKSTLSQFEVEQIIRDGSSTLSAMNVDQTDDTVQEAQEKMPLPEGMSSLSLTLNNAECWVQIRDKKNKVLMNEVLPANATYHLEGEAPFSLHIGNAQSIDKLMFNGEVVDEKIYRPTARTTVSKIKLEPKEEN